MRGYKSRSSDVWHRTKDCQGHSEAHRFTLALAKDTEDVRPCETCCDGEWPDEEE